MENDNSEYFKKMYNINTYVMEDYQQKIVKLPADLLELILHSLNPDGHLKIPHLWPGQNPPPQDRQNGGLFRCFSFLKQVF